MGAKGFREAFFDLDAVICGECRKSIAPSGLPPLEFVPCPSCGKSLFIPLRVSDFMLFEPAGAGGMASVYKAYHRKLGNECCAVKILKNEYRDDEKVVQEFLTEAEIHSQVPDHPHLVRFIESGHDSDLYYYAMNFVTGDKLLRMVEQRGRLQEAHALLILDQILSAVEHIAAHGYLYRDVNAANIILPSEEHSVLLDFGLAMPIDEADAPVVNIKEVFGTPEYLPPERLVGCGEDERSTIYSLGHLATFMLTGTVVMKGGSVTKMAKKHVSSLRLGRRSYMPQDISDRSIELIDRMTAQQPADRYESFAATREAIAALLSS